MGDIKFGLNFSSVQNGLEYQVTFEFRSAFVQVELELSSS